MDQKSQESMLSKASSLKKPSKESNAGSSPLRYDSTSMVQSVKGPKTEKGSSKPSDILNVTSPTVILDNHQADGNRRVVFNQNLAVQSKSRDESSFLTAGVDENALYHINITESQRGSQYSQLNQGDMDSNQDLIKCQENETAIPMRNSVEENSLANLDKIDLVQESQQFQIMNRTKSVEKTGLNIVNSKLRLNSDLDDSQLEQDQTFQASNQESQPSNSPFHLSVHTNNRRSSVMLSTKREDAQPMEQRSLKKDKPITDSAIDIQLVQRISENSPLQLQQDQLQIIQQTSNKNFSDQKSPEFYKSVTRSNQTSNQIGSKNPQKAKPIEDQNRKPKLLKKQTSKEQQNPNIVKEAKDGEKEQQASKKGKLREEVRNSQDVRVRRKSVQQVSSQNNKTDIKKAETNLAKAQTQIHQDQDDNKPCKSQANKSSTEQKPWRQNTAQVRKKSQTKVTEVNQDPKQNIQKSKQRPSLIEQSNAQQRRMPKKTKNKEQNNSNKIMQIEQPAQSQPDFSEPPPLPVYADIGMKFDLEVNFWNETDLNKKANFRKERRLKQSEQGISTFIQQSKILEILQNDIWNILVLEVAKQQVQTDQERQMKEQDVCDSSVQFHSSSKANSFRRTQQQQALTNQNISGEQSASFFKRIQSKNDFQDNNDKDLIKKKAQKLRQGRNLKEKVRPFSTVKMIRTSTSNATKVHRENMIRNPSLAEDFLQNYVQKMVRNKSVSRMSHGLRRSVEIHKKAKGSIKDLINLDFSYLDKQDLKMASAKHATDEIDLDGHIYGIKGQSKNETLTKLRNYQQQRRQMYSTAAESPRQQNANTVSSPFDVQSEPLVGTQKQRWMKYKMEQEAKENIEIHSDYLKCRSDIPKIIHKMRVASAIQRNLSPDSLNRNRSPYRACCDSPRMLEAKQNVFSKTQIHQQKESIKRLSQNRQAYDKSKQNLSHSYNQAQASKDMRHQNGSLGKRKKRLQKLSILSQPARQNRQKQEIRNNIQPSVKLWAPQADSNQPQSPETIISIEKNAQVTTVLNSNQQSVASVSQIDPNQANIQIDTNWDKKRPQSSAFRNTPSNGSYSKSSKSFSKDTQGKNRLKVNKSKSVMKSNDMATSLKSSENKTRTPTVTSAQLKQKNVAADSGFEHFYRQAELSMNIAEANSNQRLNDSIVYIGDKSGDKTHGTDFHENILNAAHEALGSPKEVNRDASADESSYFLSNYDDKGESFYKSETQSGSISKNMKRRHMLSKARGSVPGLANCASNLSISMGSEAQSFINRSNLNLAKQSSAERLIKNSSLNRLKINRGSSRISGLELHHQESRDKENLTGNTKKKRVMSPLQSSKNKSNNDDIERSNTFNEQSLQQIQHQISNEGDIVSDLANKKNQNRILFEQINSQPDQKAPIRRQLTNISQRLSENASSQENYGIMTGQNVIQPKQQNVNLIKDSSRQQIESMNQNFYINTQESQKRQGAYGQESQPSHINQSTSNEQSQPNIGQGGDKKQITKIIRMADSKGSKESDQVVLTHNTSGQYTFNEGNKRVKQVMLPTDSQVFMQEEEISKSDQEQQDLQLSNLNETTPNQSIKQAINLDLSMQQSTANRQYTSNTNVLHEPPNDTHHIDYGTHFEKQSEKTMHKEIDNFVFDQNQEEVNRVSVAKDSMAEVVINQSDSIFEQTSNIEMDLTQPKLMNRHSSPVKKIQRNSNISMPTDQSNQDQLEMQKQKSISHPDQTKDLRKRKPGTTKNTSKQMFNEKSKLNIPSNLEESPSNSKDQVQVSLSNQDRKRSNSSKQKGSQQSKQVSFSEQKSKHENTSEKLMIELQGAHELSDQSSIPRDHRSNAEMTPSMKMHPADLNLRQGQFREQYSKNAIDAQKVKMQKKMNNKKIEQMLQ